MTQADLIEKQLQLETLPSDFKGGFPLFPVAEAKELVRLGMLGAWLEANMSKIRAVCDDWDLTCEDSRGALHDLKESVAELPGQTWKCLRCGKPIPHPTSYNHLHPCPR